jgi:Ca2+-binding RTX toxin-like protein
MAGAVEPNPGDLTFIMRQIRKAEAHRDGNVYVPDSTNPVDVRNVLLPEGLRTVTGVFNNLIPGRQNFGAADTLFPRLLPPSFRDADAMTVDWDQSGPQRVGDATSYRQTAGIVEDSDPRTISNLIVDMSARNPAAEAAAADTPGSERVDHDNDPATPDLFRIPNRAPDEALSAPYNAWFTAFGQFFDHGLDLVTKGGGTVVMPLATDDPLYRPGVPTNFMALTRAANQPGPDGALGTDDDVREHTNTTSPFVDQNQTYTSHPSHQVFLREYADTVDGIVSTSRLLDSNEIVNGQERGGLATWADVKQQASRMLGIRLEDTDVLNVPLLRTDAYGEYERGPNGYPLIELQGGGSLEGDPTANGGAGVAIPGNARRTNHAFLDDIAHDAVPTEPGYDAALLDDHVITGDGRGNENIGLTAVHHVFHTEHNLLVGDIKRLVEAEEVKRPGFKADWLLPSGEWDGERLFQAARFMTEMQYQHLVFEEFARKVQPQVDIFVGYQADIDPAITAEFAHTVYRFGHSMLNERLARTSADGQVEDVDLIDAFLNPRSFTDDGNGNQITPNVAAGSLARGMTTQVGNEIDEFVTDGVRNNLLGLPLDLAAINLARGRDTGVPSLNSARRQFYAETSHPALVPYDSWTDFQLGLRHPRSLVNFVAAYGTHPSITAATTLAGKRAAAELLVDGGAGAPSDRLAFLNSTGDVWSNDADGVTNTGLDDVDFWIGGLAEKQMPFGGLLGSTFNFVFETQMEKLQDGDRLYYLTRTAGLNFLTQLEENSFAELVMRTTDAKHLPFDVFSTPDYAFELANLGTSGPILDDAATSYDENQLLIRMANGTVRFDGPEHVLMGGTGAADRMRTGDGDDTLWGDESGDRMEGGAGNDALLGGDGDDIITDIFGDDTIKGGHGNDAVNAGSGIDLILASLGQDFVVAGTDPKETFAGEDDDFVLGGPSTDVVFGNGGHDWMEGGSQADEINGEHAEPFFADDAPSHDVLNGDGGDDELHAEGGDDIMIASPGLEFHEGMLGYDWATHRGDPLAAASDLSNTGLQQPDPSNLNDFYDLVEGLSGWDQNDRLRGKNPSGRAGDQLTQASIDLVSGLDAVVGSLTPSTVDNIMMGGAGNDLIEGRGGNDVIDGDSWLNAQLEAPNPATQNPSDRQLVDSMTKLQKDVFAGRINPADIEIVRSVETTVPGPDNVDVAVYSAPRSAYDIRRNDDGSVTVTHVGNGADGTDTLRNVEFLRFPGSPADVSIGDAGIPGNHTATGTVTIGNQPAQQGSPLSVSGADTFADVDGYVPGVTDVTYEWQVESSPRVTEPSTPRWTTVATNLPGETPEFTPAQQQVGKRIRVVATFEDGHNVIESLTSAPTGQVGNVDDDPTGKPAVNGTGEVRQPLSATTTDIDDADGVAGATFRFQWEVQQPDTSWANIAGATGASFTPGDEYAGKRLRVTVSFTDDLGSPEQATSDPVDVLAIVPDPPTAPGVTPGVGSAQVTWTAPSDGGSPITGYTVRVRDLVTGDVRVFDSPTTTLDVTGLTNGSGYGFSVAAVNARGTGSFSPETRATPGALPAAPRNAQATPGNRTVTLTWTPPPANGEPVTGYEVRVLDNLGQQVGELHRTDAVTTSLVVTGLTNGKPYRFEISAVNRIGVGAAASAGPVVPATVATRPRDVRAKPGVKSATVSWIRPADDGGSAITGYRVQVFTQAGARVGQPWTTNGTSLVVTGLTNGRSYRFKVLAVNGAGAGPAATSNLVTPANPPSAPRIKSPSKGDNGGPLTATARWEPPSTNGGSPITGYRVVALKMTGRNSATIAHRFYSPMLAAGQRTHRMVLPAGAYRFKVAAYNAVGKGPRSKASKEVDAR